MLYRLYVYNSTMGITSSMPVRIVNTAISTHSERQWKDDNATRYMCQFDANAVKKQIDNKLGDKCKVMVCYPPKKYEQKEYLFIATSFARIREVLPCIQTVVMANRLMLYDAETERTFSPYESLIDDAFINCRIREQELRNRILKEMKPVWHIRKICSKENECVKSASYCVTVRKDAGKPFIKRVAAFYNCLKTHLLAYEKLDCNNKAFKVSGEFYSITFVLEGYKKHANKIGYYENGKACEALLHRMGVEEACKWMNGCSDKEKSDISDRLFFLEMEHRFPNPADRIVNSVRITKWQRKQVFGVRYSGIGYYGSEILFHIVPSDFYQDSDSISVLKIEEESATFILPFIEDVYPYIYERYYLEKNYLPTEMWRTIVDRIKEAKELIINDTYSTELAKYIESFNLFVLDDHNDPRLWKTNKEYDPTGFMYEHRYEIAYLYDIFIQWSETQLEYYNGEGRMFNIQGP